MRRPKQGRHRSPPGTSVAGCRIVFGVYINRSLHDFGDREMGSELKCPGELLLCRLEVSVDYIFAGSLNGANSFAGASNWFLDTVGALMNFDR